MPNNDAFETLNPAASSPVIILCDHASRRIPPEISDNELGLHLDDLHRHIAYDVGAYPVARLIGQHLDSTVIAARFSRLLIDANRGETDPTLVMRLYDGTVIPGNRRIGPGETEQRLARFHRPYHSEIGRIIDAKLGTGVTPVLVSIHSFAPQLRGRAKRPWHIGVLWAGDDRLARPFMLGLGESADVCVGNNEPYSGGLPGDTLHRHGIGRGLPHLLIEFRNDLIADAAGQADWASRVLPALTRSIKLVLAEETANG